MANEESHAKERPGENPFQGWLLSFRENFTVSSAWFRFFPQTTFAFFWVLVTHAPVRIYRLVYHLFQGLVGLFQWFLADGWSVIRQQYGADWVANTTEIIDEELTSFAAQVRLWISRGLRSLVVWLGLLITKSADLVGLGEFVDVLTMILKINTRGLTDIEIQEAKKVFGDSLEYWRIRIDEWSLIANLGKWSAERRLKHPVGHMAVTVFNTIHFSRKIHPKPGNNDMAWLIHELTHVAQNFHVGSQFMFEALHAQGAEGYHYGGPKALEGRDFSSFNREQQGDIARDFYMGLYKKDDPESEQRVVYRKKIDQLRAGHF